MKCTCSRWEDANSFLIQNVWRWHEIEMIDFFSLVSSKLLFLLFFSFLMINSFSSFSIFLILLTLLDRCWWSILRSLRSFRSLNSFFLSRSLSSLRSSRSSLMIVSSFSSRRSFFLVLDVAFLTRLWYSIDRSSRSSSRNFCSCSWFSIPRSWCSFSRSWCSSFSLQNSDARIVVIQTKVMILGWEFDRLETDFRFAM